MLTLPSFNARWFRTLGSGGVVVGLVGLAACDLFSLQDPTAVTTASVVTIAPAESTLVADGVAQMRVSANLGTDTPDNVDVIFKTSAGQFVSGDGSLAKTVTVKGGARKAVATYIADNRAEPATLSVTIGTVTADSTIRLTPALPAQILLVPSKTTAKASGSDPIDLKASLLLATSTGLVSRGTRVDFVVTDSATGTELTDLRGLQVLDGVGTFQVTNTITSSVARVAAVVASVTDGSTTIPSKKVYVTFVP
jgi:hypothetical protein